MADQRKLQPDPSIYTVGGTVQTNEQGLYLPRPADGELLALCRRSDFAYVLTPRQMGKSSLMIRTAEELLEEGRQAVIIDLTQIGTQVSVDEWYRGLLTIIADQLELRIRVADWWESHSDLGVTQRLTRFFEDVVVAEVPDPVVIFVDEIDTTLSLNFTDDFFAAIRFLYVARATQPALRRLSFVLIGVATPGDLIRDPKRTPFNVGQRVDVTDFTPKEALPLMAGLGVPPEQAPQVLGWVLKWTGGHPYLTQRLCQAMAQVGGTSWTEKEVDRLVTQTFLGAMSEQDNNLQFVRDMLTKRAPEAVGAAAVLKTYREIRRGKPPVLDEEQSLVKNHLKLSGVVKRQGRALQLRNAIYRQVFDWEWIKTHLPENLNLWQLLKPVLPFIASLLFMFSVLMAGLATYAGAQYQRAKLARQEAEVARQEAEVARQEAEKQRQEAQNQREDAVKQRLLVEELFLGGSSRVAKQDLSPEVKAFLDTLAWSLGRLSANGYKLKLDGEEFDSFNDHPRSRVCGEFYGNGDVCADSAGRYHIVSRTWDPLARRLGLRDFSPESQDMAAVELLRERGALNELESGNFESAIYKISGLWVTVPDETGYSRFGYKTYSIEELKFMYSIFYARYKP